MSYTRVITEGQLFRLIRHVISESLNNQVSPLYHFTMLKFLLGILKDRRIKSNPDTSSWGFQVSEPFISFTRDKTYNVIFDKKCMTDENLGPIVRIEFDPMILRNSPRGGKLKPYHFDSYEIDQKEERLWTDKGLDLDLNMINRIDICLRDINVNNIDMLMQLFNYPEIVNKTFLYYIKYGTNDFLINGIRTRKNKGLYELNNEDYFLYKQFLLGNRKYSVPLVSIKSIANYQLSNYERQSKYEDPFNRASLFVTPKEEQEYEEWRREEEIRKQREYEEWRKQWALEHPYGTILC